MTQRGAVSCCLLTLLAILVTPATSVATFPGQNGRIAFSQEDGISQVIRTINPDGSDLRTLTTGISPSWSADGGAIVFASCCTFAPHDLYRFGIGVMPAGGGATAWLATAVGEDSPSPEFSPDGSEIVYTTGNAIRAVRLDGTGNRRIIHVRQECCLLDPTFSPDGSQIAFGGTPRLANHAGIWTMRPDGSRLRRLTKQRRDFADSAPSYSPDGGRIAFQRRRQEKGIAVMQRDGTGLHTLRKDGTGERTLPSTFFMFGPSFAPAGDLFAASRVSFTSTKEPCGSAVILTPSGSELNQLAYGGDGVTCVSSVSWQPLPRP